MAGAKPYVPTAARPARPNRKRPDCLTVDIHCHVHVDAAAKIADPHLRPEYEPFMVFTDDATNAVNRQQMADRMVHLTSVDKRFFDMEDMGIDIQTIIPTPPQCYYWLRPELGAETSRIVNDSLADLVAKHSDRFVAFGTLPMQDADLAVAEMTRGVTELGLKGFQILTNVNGEELSSERLRIVFEKAQSLDTLLFLHPNGFTEGRRLSHHYFSNVVGNPFETTLAVHHLIFDGVLEQFPDLRILCAHGGGYLPAYSGRIDHAHGARPDCRQSISKPPTSYLKKLYFDTVVFTPHQLKYLIDLYGADHIVMGTDYPYDMADYDPVGLVESVAGLDAADGAEIMGGNAAKLLRLEG